MNNFIAVLIHYFQEVIPAVLIGFLISGIIHRFVPAGMVERYLGKKGILPIAWATVVGVFLPVCCWGSLPIAVSFHKKGSRLGPILAFLVATPATSVSALIVSYRLLGLGFTVYIFFSVILMGIIIGVIGNIFPYKPKEACPHCAEGEVKVGVLRFAFIEMPKDIGLEILIGIVLAAVVASFLPIGKLVNNYLSGNTAYLFSIVVGLIMYFCSTASVPLIDALIDQGMNIGAAFSLLIIGPITSYGTILVLRKEFGMKVVLFFLFSICLLAAILGVVYAKIIFTV